jgi:ABC-type phosphate transport system substrate-binding protein
MRVVWAIAILVVVLWAEAPPAGASVHGRQFVIIVNKQNQLQELSVAKLKTIFLRRISRWPWGAAIDPVDLPEDSVLRREFAREVLNTTLAELGVYWIDQKATRSVNPPVVAPSVEAVKAAVAAQPGAIGYIPASAVDARVRILELLQ